MRRGVFATLMLFWVTSGVVAGQTGGTGNALAGRELAGMTCAPSCHVVAGDQKQGPLLPL
jgi:hypothetical protein